MNDLSTLIDTLNQRIDAAVPDPARWVRSALERVSVLSYLNVRMTAARNQIEEFAIKAAVLISEWNLGELRRAIISLEIECRRLATPLPPRLFADELQTWHKRLMDLGWSGLELDWVQQLWGKGEVTILAADLDSITLSTAGVITRLMVRTASRPAWMPADEWEAGREFNVMKQAHDASRESARAEKANAIPRVSSGPARLIGKAIPTA